jgi:hypothetical protein
MLRKHYRVWRKQLIKSKDMKLVLIIGATFLIFLIKSCMPAAQKIEPETVTNKPSKEKPNNKLVIVENISKTEIDSVLNKFCTMYNKEKNQAKPRLYKLNESQFAITFPFDIEFEIFCYFVNYVHYPMGFDKSFSVTAWETTKQANSWIIDKTANKKVMLFIPEDDNERDNVFLTTEDNISYKVGFAIGQEKQLLQTPKKKYFAPTFDIKVLTEKEAQDFQ